MVIVSPDKEVWKGKLGLPACIIGHELAAANRFGWLGSVVDIVTEGLVQAKSSQRFREVGFGKVGEVR